VLRKNLEYLIDDTVSKSVERYHGAATEIRGQQMHLSNLKPLSPVEPGLECPDDQAEGKNRAFPVHRAVEGIGRAVEVSKGKPA